MTEPLGYEDAAARLNEILQQELACDEKLDGLAQLLLPLANVGEAEGEEEDSEGDDDGEDAEPAVSAARKPAAKKAVAKKSSNAR